VEPAGSPLEPAGALDVCWMEPCGNPCYKSGLLWSLPDPLRGMGRSRPVCWMEPGWRRGKNSARLWSAGSWTRCGKRLELLEPFLVRLWAVTVYSVMTSLWQAGQSAVLELHTSVCTSRRSVHERKNVYIYMCRIVRAERSQCRLCLALGSWGYGKLERVG
jgi:hypothetical protein